MEDTEKAVKDVLAGDPDSYAIVVRSYQARLRAFIATYFPDKNQVDEIAQRTFIWIFEHLHHYEAGTNLYAWIKSVCRNTMLSELEVQKRDISRKQRYLEYMQTLRSYEDLQNSNDDNKEDTVLRLKKCMKKLPVEMRDLLELRYDNSYSIQSLAQKISESESAIKVRLFRIRQSLKECIKKSRSAL